MFNTYYIAVQPETVLSVVNAGEHPENKLFTLEDNPLEAVIAVAKPLSQIFILQLHIPVGFEPPIDNVLKFFDPGWIQNIVVFSEQGYKLLSNIFNNNCPMMIFILPESYAGLLLDEVQEASVELEFQITPPDSQDTQEPQVLSSSSDEGSSSNESDESDELPIYSKGLQYTSYFQGFEEDELDFNSEPPEQDKLQASDDFQEVIESQESNEKQAFEVFEDYRDYAEFQQAQELEAEIEQSFATHKRARATDLGKIEALYVAANNNQDADITPFPSPIKFSKNSHIKESQELTFKLKRISSYQAHLGLLKFVFKYAKNRIVIATNGIDPVALNMNDMKALIIEARARGVKIFIYNSHKDSRRIDNNTREFFLLNNIDYRESNTHCKVLIYDSSLLSVGSFDWLKAPAFPNSTDSNASVVYCGDDASILIESILEYMEFYLDKSFIKTRKIKLPREYRTDFSSANFVIEYQSNLELLSTLQQHRNFIELSLGQAKHKIIICSPYISGNGQFKGDFNKDLLLETVAKGVDIYFICSEKAENFQLFDTFVAELKSDKIHLIKMQDVHLKTVVVDNKIIAEGSFNWLSAIRNEKHSSHNHEVTLVIRGNKAAELIEQFNHSRVGEELFAKMIKSSPYSPK